MGSTSSKVEGESKPVPGEDTPLLVEAPASMPTPPEGSEGPDSGIPASSSILFWKRSMSDHWDNYNSSLERNPLLVKGVTAFFILGLGDLCGQGVEHLRGTNQYDSVDWPRVIRFGCFGLFGAPWAHYYFLYLDRFLPPTPEPLSWTTLTKLLIDQGIQAPLLLCFIIILLALLSGKGIEGAKHDMHENYWKTLIVNCKCLDSSYYHRKKNRSIQHISFLFVIGKLWIPANFVNYAFVKPSLRVLFVNILFFFWTIILSIMLNGHNDDSTGT